MNSEAQPQKNSTERRNNFRLEDDIYLDIKPLTSLPNSLDAYDPSICSKPELILAKQMHKLEHDAQHLLKLIHDDHPPTAQYLKNLNKRLGIIHQLCSANLADNPLTPNKTATLSTHGLDFLHTEVFAVESLLHLQITLFPSLEQLCLFAKVIHSSSKAEKHHIGVQFLYLTDTENQLISRHLIQTQSRQRRQNRSTLNN